MDVKFESVFDSLKGYLWIIALQDKKISILAALLNYLKCQKMRSQCDDGPIGRKNPQFFAGDRRPRDDRHSCSHMYGTTAPYSPAEVGRCVGAVAHGCNAPVVSLGVASTAVEARLVASGHVVAGCRVAESLNA